MVGLCLILQALPSDVEDEDWAALAELQQRINDEHENAKHKAWQDEVRRGW